MAQLVKKLHSDSRISWFVLLSRLVLGGIFITAALFKIPHQAEFIRIVYGYGLLSRELTELYGMLLPWLELLLGLFLVLGLFPRWCAALLSGIIGSFIIANVHAITAAGGGTGLCGCFGEIIPLTHAQSLAMDMLMLSLAVPLMFTQVNPLSVRKNLIAGYVMKACGILVAAVMLAGAISPAVTQASPTENESPSPAPAPTDIHPDTSKPVLLFFYAEWCHYCQRQGPIIDELETEYGDRIAFVRVNSEENADLLKEWNVETIPTIILGFEMSTAEECTRYTGFTEKQVLADALDTLLAETCPTPVETAPSETETAVTGNTSLDYLIDASLIDGTPVFLFFYATWCHFCQQEHPIVDELEEEYSGNITFIRAESSAYPDDLTAWGVTGFPSMFLVIDVTAGAYTYQEFGGFTEKDVLASSFDYLLESGHLPEGTAQTGYVHHSCSLGTCYKNCIADKFKFPTADQMGQALLDAVLDCVGVNAFQGFQAIYSNVKTGVCAYACATADTPREIGDCGQCIISETLGKIPGVGCAVDAWNFLGDLLEPHADCLAECAAPSSTWEQNWGHTCRDHQGDSSRCAGPNVMEALECKDCEWSVWKVYICDDGCEMQNGQAVCKGKCNETDCDDHDECTIDWCYEGECRHERKIGGDCGCPESCDDGNPCTTDYCDEDGNCQHDRQAGCCPTSCADSDQCTRDWCDGNGSCRHARVPGCDHPDDNNDYSTFPEYDVLPVDDNSDITVLNNGFADSLLDALGTTNRTAALVDPSLQGVNHYGILIIPSGGLAGLDTSELFRERLWNYVANGGTLISFDQQRGKEFEVLPGGDIRGYGWYEDQSCNGVGSVALTEYHPIFSGLNTTDPIVNVDGFFTAYPANASVLLTRVKNGQPAMLLYNYGQGRVLTTTLYPDMSTSLYMRCRDEPTLLRDMLAWAETHSDIETHAPGTVEVSIPVTNPLSAPLQAGAPAFNIGDLVQLSVDVTNSAALAADNMTLALYDPHFHPHNLELAVDIPPGESRTVNITYQTVADAEPGVWTMLYFLYNGSDYIGADYAGEFTLGYDTGEASQFQAYVTVTDPQGTIKLDTTQPLNIPPGETDNLTFTVNVPDTAQELGIWNARYSVLDTDGNVLVSSSQPFAVSIWSERPEGWGYQGIDINYSITSDEEAYLRGETATFTVHFWNHSATERIVTCWFSFPHNYWTTDDPVYGAPGTTGPGHRSNLYRTVIIPAQQGGTAGYTSFDYSVTIISYDRLWAQFYDGDETSQNNLGIASRGIRATTPSIKVSLATNEYEYTGKDIPVTVTLENAGEVSQDVTTQVSLGKAGEPPLDTASISTALDAFQTSSQTVTLTAPPDADFGTYQIMAKAMTDGRVAGGATILVSFVRQYTATLALDRPDGKYAARSTMQVEATMSNSGEQDWEGDVQLDIPDIGYTKTGHVVVPAGGSQVLTFDDIVLPPDIARGSYTVTFSVPAESYVKNTWFYVPSSSLAIAAGQTEVDAGGVVTVDLNNTGGVDTTARCSLMVSGVQNISFYGTVDVRTDQATVLPLPVPVSTPGGVYDLFGSCRDESTVQYVSLHDSVTIRGSELEMSLAADTYTGGDTVSIGLANTGFLDTSYQCSISLRDGNNYLTYDGTYSGDLNTGDATALDFTIPGQAASGTYHLDATCTDMTTSKTTNLYDTLTVAGLDTLLTSVTDREIYLTGDTVTLQSQINNTGPALAGGSLKLRVWQTVEGGSGSAVSQAWVAGYGPIDFAGSIDIARDAAGNIYVIGAVRGNGGRPDYLTVKYNSSGIEQWTAVYDGGREDIPYGIAVDAAGNVYVTGTSEAPLPGSLTQWQDDCTTVKYDSGGTEVWVARYADNPENNDYGQAVRVDADGNVYVSGSRYNPDEMWNYLAIKYDSDGVQQWASTYNGPATGFYNWDMVAAMAVDADGNVYVTGQSNNDATYSDYATVKYNSDDGSEAWVARYNGDTGYDDAAYGIAVDASGNVYVTGDSANEMDNDIVTVMYDGNGVQQWASPYDGPYGNDDAGDIAVDGSGNVYVTGRCDTGMGDVEMPSTAICTIKYNASGTEQWAKVYGDESSAGGLALDAAGNAYVTGRKQNPDWTGDFLTIKYDTADGSAVWTITYNDNFDDDDMATGIVVGEDGAVYVTGYGMGESGAELTTVKYTQGAAGVLVWEKIIQPVDVSAGGTGDIDTPVSMPAEFPGITGKLYHSAELYNTDGQRLATSETHTFYITGSSLSLTLETNKEFYRPGETVAISGELTNAATAPDSGTLVVTKDGNPIYTAPFNLQPGETLGFSTSTVADTDFLLEATANTASASDNIEVRPYGVNLEILAPDVVGLDPFNAIVSLENQSDTDYNVHLTLAGAAWDVTLEAGETVLRDTTISITEDTQLVAELSGDVVMSGTKSVIMGSAATVGVTPAASYAFGDVEIPFSVDNTGSLDLFVDITFSVNGHSENRTVFAAAGDTVPDTVSFALGPGTYTLSYESDYSTGTAQIEVTGGPEYDVTLPDNLDVAAGDPTWDFTVRNVGGSGGFVELYLMTPDWEDTQSAWLEAGEETVFSFAFTIPDDLESGSYHAFFEINGERHSFVFNVAGPEITVDASLDKSLYSAGETAVLTLDIENISTFDLELSARAHLGDFEEVQAFSLPASGTTVLQFDVPVDFDSGKLFYGIYVNSGRALHFNALYIYERQPLGLWTDSQVYNIGDTVTVSMEAPAAGTVDITAPGYADQINLPAGVSTTQFDVPVLTAGTYYIDYTFNGAAARYPFDVRGYTGRITGFDLDKSTYQAGDSLTITVTAEVSLASDGTMHCRIMNESGSLIGEFETSVSLAEGENVINASTVFGGVIAGLYSIRCQLQAEVSGQTLALASASQFFDAAGLNAAPACNAGVFYAATEGSVVLFDADSYDPNNDALQYRWDFDSDGVWDTGWSADNTAANTWPDDWTGTATVQTTDGQDSSTDTAPVRVSNVPPVVSASASPLVINAGQAVSFSGSFTDYGVLDTHTILWSFGDGGTKTGILNTTHVYGTVGTFTAALTVTDDDGGADTRTLTIVVQSSGGGGATGGGSVPTSEETTEEEKESKPTQEAASTPDFNIGDFTVTSGQIRQGDTFNINVNVRNTGQGGGTYKLELEIDGVIVQTKEVTLNAGENRTISFSVVADTAGVHLAKVGDLSLVFEILPLANVGQLGPANLQISGLSVMPFEVAPGEPVIITAVVTNRGNSEATDTVVLWINGNEEERQEVTFIPGEGYPLLFKVVRNAPGDYTVRLGTELGKFSVTMPAVAALPTGTPEAIAPSPEPEGRISWWSLAGIIIGALILLGLATKYVLDHRRD